MATQQYYEDFYKNKDWKDIPAITRFKTKVYLKITKSIFNNKQINTVVDAGCGTGLYTAILSKDYNKVFGFDFSKEAINKAKQKFKGIDFRQLDGANLSYKNNEIDLFFAKGFSPFNTTDFQKTTNILEHWHKFLSQNGLVCLITKSNFSAKAPTGWIYLTEKQLNKIYDGNKYKKQIIYLFPPFWIVLYFLPKSKYLTFFLSYISKSIFIKIFKLPVTVLILLQKK